jgi:hypothetical protein
MKKIFLAAGILLTTATVTFSQTSNDAKAVKMERTEAKKELRSERRAENRNEVNVLTRDQFAIDFPGAKNVQFVKTKYFDEVTFLSGKKKLRAFYDDDNELVGTTQAKAFNDLPENAQKEIHKKYAGYAIADVIKFDDNETNDTDMIMFGTSFEDADNYFVELKKGNKAIVVKADLAGNVTFFTDMK